MYYLNTAAIFFLGHPYIESTTVLSDRTHFTLKMNLLYKHSKISYFNSQCTVLSVLRAGPSPVVPGRRRFGRQKIKPWAIVHGFRHESENLDFGSK